MVACFSPIYLLNDLVPFYCVWNFKVVDVARPENATDVSLHLCPKFWVSGSEIFLMLQRHRHRPKLETQ